jgi:large subunit ribosomal protein L10Ae
MSAKINNAMITEAIADLRKISKDRKFKQTVELQIGLKDYDPQKDKRFVGQVVLPSNPRPNLKICIIADEKHKDEVAKRKIDIDVVDLDYLKKFNKDKKQIKSWAKRYAMLIASDTVLKKVPVVCGPILNRIQKFPQVVTHAEPLDQKVSDLRSSVKWQLKKVTCLNAAVGKEDMTDEDLRINIMMAVNFLISLLKKGWHNMKSVNIKTTMSKAIKLM